MRLDIYLVKRGYCRSRDRAKGLIRGGFCTVNRRVVKKSACDVKEGDDIRLKREDFSYVSRGGLKLEAALKEFEIDVNGMVALDVGCATGGFTDCLLGFGVKKVYALDIGKGQFAEKLFNDERVVYISHKDIRDAKSKDFDDLIDIIVIDVSFISVVAILESLHALGTRTMEFVFLIKPQYETGKKHKGVLKDPEIVKEILGKVRGEFVSQGYFIQKEISSPIFGKEGNAEFLWHVRIK